MLNRTFTYEDYNGETRSETATFNLTKAELIEFQLAYGDLKAYLERAVEKKDGAELYPVMKNLILKAYGVKSIDGRKIEKSQELSDDFSQTPMFSDLVIELLSDLEKAVEFISAIMPITPDGATVKEIVAQAKEQAMPTHNG